jgi:hypothetical protein
MDVIDAPVDFVDAPSSNMDAMASPEVNLVKPAACPAGPFAAPMAGTPQVVCNTGDSLSALRYDSTTGAVWVPTEGAFFFSTFPSTATPTPLASGYPAAGSTMGDIVKYTPGAGCEIVFQDVGTLGLTVARDGRLIGASFKTSSISEFNLVSGQPTVLVGLSTGVGIGVPIGVVVSSNGTIYFTNIDGSLGKGVFRVPPSSSIAMTLLPPNWAYSNGPYTGMTTLSADETRLLAFGFADITLNSAGQETGAGNDITAGNRGALAFDCADDIAFTSATSGKILSLHGNTGQGFPIGLDLAFGGPDGLSVLLLNKQNISVVPMTVPGVL